VSAKGRLVTGTVNIAVLNTAARLQGQDRLPPCFLIVDECHRAASPEFRTILQAPSYASLGLSATPQRQYDDWFNTVLVPALGPKIFEYSYKDALRDGVIVPFTLNNVVFDLEPERQAEYEQLTRSIARTIGRFGADSEQAVALMLKRARVVNLSENRIRLALTIVSAHRTSRVLVFHEDIEACEVIYEVLKSSGIRAGLYHSRQPLRQRAEVLGAYRSGALSALVTCRALDEGFNVPETEVGIIAASTATHRQRIQRLGRILRPARGKQSALVYTLAASRGEVERLAEEEERLEGVAEVTWSHA
jgi:superfamily II DNA or RNA helicase